MDQHSKRSHPNKAVDVIVCQTFWIAFGSRAINSCLLSAPAFPNKSLGIVLSLSASSPFSWPATQPPPSAPTGQGAAAHTPLHSPTTGAVRLPTSVPPLSPLASSHSSHRARIAATHTVVSPCPVRTAPRYTTRSPPAAGAPSCPRLC